MKKSTLVLVLLLLLHLSVNSFWLFKDAAQFPWDPSSHSLIALALYQRLTSLDFPGLLTASNYYPIFVHLIAALVVLVYGVHLRVLAYVGTLFFLASIFLTYKYALLLFRKQDIAFLSAAIYSFFPVIFNYSHFLMLDIPLTGSIILSLYMLEKSNYLTNKKFTNIFFICLGVVVMTKWTGLVFVFIPLLFICWEIYRQKSILKVYRNVLLGAVLFLIIVLPWYVINLHSLLTLSKISIEGTANSDPQNLLSSDNLTLYLKVFINYMATPVPAIAFFISCIYLLTKRIQKINILIISIAFEVVFFTFIGNKDSRYIMPILPLVAIIVAYALNIFTNKKKVLGKSITYLILLFMFVNYFFLSLRPSFAEGKYFYIPFPLVGSLNVIDINEWLVTKYDTTSWPDELIFHDIGASNPTTLIIGVEYWHLNPSTMQLLLTVNQMENRYTNLSLKTPDAPFLLQAYNQPSFPNQAELEKFLSSGDYIIISPVIGNLGTQYLRNRPALEQLQKYILEDNLSDCSLYIKQISQRYITCYVKTGEVLSSTSDLLINDKLQQKGQKTIAGFKKVSCPWGCSFGLVSKVKIKKNITVKLLKVYNLPNGDKLNLYKINH